MHCPSPSPNARRGSPSSPSPAHGPGLPSSPALAAAGEGRGGGACGATFVPTVILSGVEGPLAAATFVLAAATFVRLVSQTAPTPSPSPDSGEGSTTVASANTKVRGGEEIPRLKPQ